MKFKNSLAILTILIFLYANNTLLCQNSSPQELERNRLIHTKVKKMEVFFYYGYNYDSSAKHVPINKEIFEYNTKGDKVRSEYYTFNESGDLEKEPHTRIYRYDSKGLLITTESIADRDTIETSFFYNERNLLTFEFTIIHGEVSLEPSLLRMNYYRYDSLGRLAKEVEYDLPGVSENISGLKLTHFKSAVYDSSGTRRIWNDKVTRFSYQEMLFQQFENGYIEGPGGKGHEAWEYRKYDSQGYVIEEKRGLYPEPFIMKYQFDEKGNPVEKTTYYKGERSSVARYRYEYFE
ncbi:MAG: hypothetical protein EPO24_16115 [Bacteroidetes bacterium]|nr:MAG: hypothetical protein EPO24_16115 [Bacteroidota bacterium]